MNRVRIGDQGEYRKRINSGGNLMNAGLNGKKATTLLEEIDEETHHK